MEASPEHGGAVPPHLVEPVSSLFVALSGTTGKPCRCVALEGRIGDEVACAIYASRPSPCREFGDERARCDQARARHGLPPLTDEEAGEVPAADDPDGRIVARKAPA